MPVYGPPICMSCVHFDRESGRVGFFCTAFPLGIPEAILQSRADHRKPYQGDNGIQYAQKPGERLNTKALDDGGGPMVEYTPPSNPPKRRKRTT